MIIDKLRWDNKHLRLYGKTLGLILQQNETLIKEHDIIVRALNSLGFQLKSYSRPKIVFLPGRHIAFHCAVYKSNEVWWHVREEGGGFNLCFHLLGYMLLCIRQPNKYGIEIQANSFRGILHPLLKEALKEQINALQSNCVYLNHQFNPLLSKHEVRCAVHPYRTDCLVCPDYTGKSTQPYIKWLED